jgi:hypothetical protein
MLHCASLFFPFFSWFSFSFVPVQKLGARAFLAPILVIKDDYAKAAHAAC